MKDQDVKEIKFLLVWASLSLLIVGLVIVYLLDQILEAVS